MGQYLIDTNVISDYFSGAFSANAMSFLADVIDKVPNLSVITKIEALSWRNPNVAKEKSFYFHITSRRDVWGCLVGLLRQKVRSKA